MIIIKLKLITIHLNNKSIVYLIVKYLRKILLNTNRRKSMIKLL